jgi:putative tryptophan/tyrosine transport system substrate-binding protein
MGRSFRAVQELSVNRRHLVQGAGAVGLGLLAGCGRWPGQAQDPVKVPRVGHLSFGAPDSADEQAFQQRLNELGYVDGQTVLIEYRSAEGHDERYPGLAAELVGLPVDVLVARGLAVARAAKAVTSTVPIVFTGVSDPVGSGLVASLAQPGGNLTGLSAFATELSGKRLQLLQDTVPHISRVAALAAHTTSPTQVRETEGAARALGLQLQLLEVRGPDELEPAFDAAAVTRAQALVILLGAPLVAASVRIAELAVARQLPSIAPDRRFIEAGGLMSYGPNLSEMGRRAAEYVDKILKGAKAADLPVEQPMLLDFVINAKTAQALGLTIPPHVLLQATEVIQ